MEVVASYIYRTHRDDLWTCIFVDTELTCKSQMSYSFNHGVLCAKPHGHCDILFSQNYNLNYVIQNTQNIVTKLYTINTYVTHTHTEVDLGSRKGDCPPNFTFCPLLAIKVQKYPSQKLLTNFLLFYAL